MNWTDLPAHLLVQACAKPDSSAAWEEFVRRYHSVITAASVRVCRRWGSDDLSEIDDAIQEIYLKLCANRASVLTTFRNGQPEAILGYLKVVSTNIVHDYYRRKSAVKRGPRRPVAWDSVADLVPGREDLDRQLTLAELDRILDANTQTPTGTRDRAIFRFYYRYGMTAAAIAELPGIALNPKGVEAVIHRLTGTVRIAATHKQDKSLDLRPRKEAGVD